MPTFSDFLVISRGTLCINNLTLSVWKHVPQFFTFIFMQKILKICVVKFFIVLSIVFFNDTCSYRPPRFLIVSLYIPNDEVINSQF